ncbi:MAG: hypothetical protein FJ087_04750 [Deltaproteobacteria bacterium]|nr:hypothetical protein [Deltaproteobacteria bacterium]
MTGLRSPESAAAAACFFAIGALAAGLSGCGSATSDGGADGTVANEPPSFPLSSVQDDLAEADFLALADGDADLAALRANLSGAGFGTFVVAGAVGDDAARLEFAAYSNASGETRTLVRHCAGEDCVRAVAEEADGAIRWIDAAGADVTPRAVALPPLLREQAVGGTATRVVSALSDGEPVDVAAVDLSRRRLLVMNQFGATTGLAATDVAGTLATAGGFDEVIADDHATWDAIRSAITTAYPHEVMVWIGQPVRMLHKQPVAKGEPGWYKSIGMEAASGLYGLRKVASEDMSRAFKSAPLAGPGVVLLVGSESLGDGTEGMNMPAAIPQQLELPGKVVAGFTGDAHPAVLLAVARAFLDGLGTGKTAGDARDAANGLVEAWDLPARLAFTDESDAAFRLLPPRASFWGGKVPASASMKLYLHMRLWCAAKPGASFKAIEENQGNSGFEEMEIDGPVFRGNMEREYDPGQFHRAEVVGVLGEVRKGAHFYFAYRGDVKKGYVGLTMYANAEITDVREDEAETRVSFAGSVVALPFAANGGQSCELRDTDLEPQLQGSGTSELILKY